MADDPGAYPVDEYLIQQAVSRAGGQIHAVVGIVAMYRGAAEVSPEAAQIFEKSLWRFVATGMLEERMQEPRTKPRL